MLIGVIGLILDPLQILNVLLYNSYMSNVTTLGVSPDEERSKRMLSYSISMGIRLICIGLCFIVPGWLVTLPILGAILLPWFAVVSANSKSITKDSVESPHKPVIKV